MLDALIARLPRPYIPVEVRAQVVMRQAIEAGIDHSVIDLLPRAMRPGRIVAFLLKRLFGDDPVDLDHDPPLGAREKIRNRDGEIVGYRPDANDPDWLVYRRRDAHKFKTNVKGDGAQYPDRVLIKRQRRRERPRPKPKGKWGSRPLRSANRWPPKGRRKMRSRPFRKDQAGDR